MDVFLKLKFNLLFNEIFIFYNKALNKDFNDFTKEVIDKYFVTLKSEDNSLNEIIEKSNIFDECCDKEDQLISVFSNISLDKNNGNKDSYVPLSKLELTDSIYPENDKCMDLNYKSLWNEFINELDLLHVYDDFNTILALLKKYTSTICYKGDISLFNHLKTTNALSNCLYLNLNHKTDTPFLVINGDISGIQKFIYKVSSPKKAQNGMSKRLRGRSLYLTLLIESIANNIISKLNLDSTNILFCGGGRFTIIAPNNSESIAILNKLNDEINREFIDKFNAELYLILAYQEASFDDLNNFAEIFSNLNLLSSQNKKHKFINNIQYLFNSEIKIPKKLCVVCGNGISDGCFCDECESHKELGTAIANANYLIVYSGYKKSKFHIFGNNYVFKKSKNDVIKFFNTNLNNHFNLYKLNDSNFLDCIDNIENNNVSFDFRFIANNVPSIDNKPLYFEHLAKISKGADKLGILKMDIDNLGKIFAQGFSKTNEKSNIFRVSSLSFYLDLFFSGMINEVIKKFKVYSDCGIYKDNFHEKKLKFELSSNSKKFEYKKVYKAKENFQVPKELEKYAFSTIYIAYSGGDDLLVIGPYDDIIEFSKEFRLKFKQWTGCNKHITISAGIALFNSKFPIGKSARIADDYLELSKSCGRDKITLFNQTMGWEDNGRILGFNKLFDFSKDLEILTEKDILSHGFVYSLLKIWENNRFEVKNKNKKLEMRFIDNKDDWLKINTRKAQSNFFIRKYYYKLRLVTNNQIDDELVKHLSLIENKNGLREELANKYNFIPWIKMPVSWVSLRLRN